MNRQLAGIIAGLGATVVLSMLMILKATMGMMPEVNAIKMLTGIAHNLLATAQTPIIGWLAHFLIGTFAWGLLFSLTFRSLPTGGAVSRGVVFSVAAWLVMMVVLMPMAGGGIFGLNIGLPAPIATLVLHLVYGAVLGLIFAKLVPGSVAKQAPVSDVN